MPRAPGAATIEHPPGRLQRRPDLGRSPCAQASVPSIASSISIASRNARSKGSDLAHLFKKWTSRSTDGRILAAN
jgi:hypothetical protein